MPNCKEIYHYLLKPEYFEQLQELMREQNIYESLNVREAFLKEEDFPYILFRIETEQVFAAQMVGMMLKIDSLLPEYTDDYYLPAIAMACDYDPEIMELINLENSVAHELIHIQDILSLIDKYPSYVTRVEKYGMNMVERLEDLKESIDLEVFKIFYLEPQALESDYDKGEKSIRTQLLGKILEYECRTKKEYIEMQLSDYLGNLSEIYKDKFPEEAKMIKKHTNASAVKYGKDVFGRTPLKRLRKLRKAYPSKMLLGLGIRQK
ncbi:hypothetical protein QUF80_00780 [Desulfococcaceae bacterium HSG8]|nr:hypothetical protein [Desulfococcaceae bacterium HSG8]